MGTHEENSVEFINNLSTYIPKLYHYQECSSMEYGISVAEEEAEFEFRRKLFLNKKFEIINQ
jgi:hypothetical protein